MTRVFSVFVLFLFLTVSVSSQSADGSIRGRVTDSFAAVVPGADVTVVASDGSERRVKSNQSGEFSISVKAGIYVVRAVRQGFAVYEKSDVTVVAGRAEVLEITLSVAETQAEVTVADENEVNTEPTSNAGAIVLKDADIEALPDNEDELEAALRALAGPGAGPNGGEISIDGFSGGNIPPRNSIREIRINQNPFSSEYDRLGFGRIEILTKPGTDKFRGEVEFEFEDEALNSRNPYATNRAPFQVREFSANFAGPIIKQRASYFVDLGIEDTINNALVNAVVLDQNLNATTFQQAIRRPSREYSFSPRLDFAINDRNTLVFRYDFRRDISENGGLGGFDLPTRAVDSRSSEHSIRLTETSVIGASVINETRFQYIRRRSNDESLDPSPTLRVLDAFTGGGGNTGFEFSNEDRFEFQNYTSLLRGAHSMKFGIRARRNTLDNASPGNFAGTFTFTSLDQYRRTLLNEAGFFPTQFSIAGGEPRAKIGQTDVGLFFQDDWRFNPALTLSFGLRYENQTNIESGFNFAPRFGFAWSPGATGQNRPKTVIRGGFGIFYDRFGENLSLQARRFDGLSQQQFIVTDPNILDAIVFTPNGITNIPTVAQLAGFAQPQTTRVVAPGLESPYTIQTALSIERQLPAKTTLSVTYINAATRRLFRSRNINAPIGGVRPDPTAGNVFQYESTGRLNQNQLLVNVRSNFNPRATIFGNYSLNKVKSDTDGAGTFPSDGLNTELDYGDASFDVRHRFVIGGNFTTLWKIRMSPFITFRSGVPFNITTGRDDNGDSVFTDRPAFATDLNRQCNFGSTTNPDIRSCVVQTRFGAFDLQPTTGQTIIPRNYGRAPEFFVTNLRFSRAFGFGAKNDGAAATNQGGGGGGRGFGGPFGGGGGGWRGGSSSENRFSLEFSVQIRNVFNRTNKGVPVGNLRSPFFGEPTSLAGGFGFGGGGNQAGNRRIEMELQFNF